MVRRRLARLAAPLERWLWPRAPVILMYHRVAEPAYDPWNLCTPPAVFVEQIEALGSVRRIVSLGELLERVQAGEEGGRPIAAVTLDDGYHDVYETARPILHRLDCPAMVYLTTGMIGSSREFWWDEVVRLVLVAPRLPASLSADPDPDARTRMRLCLGLRRQLRRLHPSEIQARLDALSREAGQDRTARPDHRVMSSEEAANLADELITVGAHTLNHPSLPHLSAVERQAEIGQSRRACEALVGRPVEHFAYPFGYFDDASVRAVQRAGFVSACTTVAGVVRRGSDPLRLPRLNPGRRDGDALLKLLGGG